MFRLSLAVFCAALAPFQSAQAEPETTSSIIYPGVVNKDDALPAAQKDWLGLVHAASDYRLQPLRLSAELVGADDYSTAEENKNLRRLAVTSDLPGSLLAMIPQKLRKSDGPLQTASILSAGGQQQPFVAYAFALPEALKLGFGKQRYQVGARQNLQGQCEITLSASQNTVQALSLGRLGASKSCYGGDDPPTVLWAGDLDGDDKLDLLIGETAGSGTCSAVTLYLSSSAKGSDIVAEYGGFSECDP